jgi:excisionase family DNA binding protein
MENVIMPDILTLEEASTYLRLSIETVTNEALNGNIPGRKIENDWRFLKTAIDDWLRAKNSRFILLSQAGALADDPQLKQYSIGEMFSQLRQLCEEEQYALDVPERTDREIPLLGDE